VTIGTDLFRALRGGGFRLGVVTQFDFKLHPVSTVLAAAQGQATRTGRSESRGNHEVFMMKRYLRNGHAVRAAMSQAIVDFF
jgi:hypothetical protein